MRSPFTLHRGGARRGVRPVPSSARAPEPRADTPRGLEHVVVTPGTGEGITRIVVRLPDGRRPLAIEVDRAVVSDAELEDLLARCGQFAARHDLESQTLAARPRLAVVP